MTTTAPNQAVRVRTDIFPAVLVVAPASAPTPATITRFPQPDDPDGRKLLQKVRVIVTDTNVYVFEDSPQGPHLIFSEAVASYTPPTPLHKRRVREASAPSEANLTTSTGKTLSFARLGGCGCGSRLKTFDPFPILVATTHKQNSPLPDPSPS